MTLLLTDAAIVAPGTDTAIALAVLETVWAEIGHRTRVMRQAGHTMWPGSDLPVQVTDVDLLLADPEAQGQRVDDLLVCILREGRRTGLVGTVTGQPASPKWIREASLPLRDLLTTGPLTYRGGAR